MVTIEIKLTINRPISEVYSAFTNYDNPTALQAWQKGINDVGITAGNPLRAGSMIAMRKRFGASEIFVNFDVMDFQRNKRLEVQGVHGRFFFKRETDFTPSGRETLVKDVMSVRTGWFMFWYNPILTGMLRKGLESEWQALKTILESPS